MRGRRRYRVPRRSRIAPSTSIAPVAQHRGGNAQLACDPAQRPTAAHQQGDCFSLELICKMTPSLAHSTPFRSRRSLAKVSTNSREPHVRVSSPPEGWPRIDFADPAASSKAGHVSNNVSLSHLRPRDIHRTDIQHVTASERDLLHDTPRSPSTTKEIV